MKKLFMLLLTTLISGQMTYAATNNQIPMPPKVTIPFSDPSYPDTNWNYHVNPEASAVPTIDQSSTLYLPYLPGVYYELNLLIDYVNYFYQQAQSTNKGNEIAALTNTAIAQQQPISQKTAAAWTTTNLQTILPGNNTSLKQDASQKVLRLAETPASDTTVCKSFDTDCQRRFKTVKPITNINSILNADSLLGSDGYASDQENKIKNLISLMANDIAPISSLSTKQLDLTNINVRAYVLQARALAAAQSVALSNLNFLAQERKIIPKLGEQAGMVALPTTVNPDDNKVINDASLLQIEKFLVDQRFGNSTWYTQIATDNSVAVQRQIAIMLAGIQAQLFNNYLLHERQLATLSTMLVQMTAFSKTNMLITQQTIKRADAKKDKNKSH